MPKAKIHAIVSALGSGAQPLPSLGNGARHEWRRVLDWLDASGLALYFLERLKQGNATDAVPRAVFVQLEERLSKNRERVAIIRQKFRMLNEDFRGEGVEYAALKGFSLVPEYCPDASLRALCDLDYLIGRDSIDRAEKVLLRRGYTLKTHRGGEFIFWKPTSQPKSESQQYDPQTACPVELHVTTWDHGLNEVPVAVRTLPLDHVVFRQSEGVVFYSLPEEEIFVGQVLHAFRHWVWDSKVRPSWLFEIGYFLKRRQNGEPIWNAVNHLIDSDSLLGEVIGIMVRLTTLVFGEVHPQAELWAAALNPAVQRWLEMYGRESVLAECNGYDTGLFPRSKLILFVKQLYSPDVQTALGLRRRSLVPMRGLRRLIAPPERSYNSSFEGIRKKLGWFASCSIHDAGANLRYFWELPRWQGIRKSSPRRSQD